MLIQAKINRFKQQVTQKQNQNSQPKTRCQHVISGNRRLLLSAFPFLFIPAQKSQGLELEDVLDKFSVPFPPEPVKIPRKKLNESFAVLLMRSCYEAVDALDFVAMDKFQVKFWKLRQSELEPYTFQYSPIKMRMGELTDPLYFDFISFSQFASIAQEINNGQTVFKEYCGECEDQSYRIIKRDASISDNELLPDLFQKTAGDLIYAGLLQGFRGEQFNAPPPIQISQQSNSNQIFQLKSNLQEILDIMVKNGYALNAEISKFERDEDSQSWKFRVDVKAPSNLWGLQNLQFRRSAITNVYDAMVLQAYLRLSGFSSKYNFKLSDTGISERWQIQQI